MTINMVVRVLEKKHRRAERLKMLAAMIVTAMTYAGLMALWLLEII